jgi:hypothetical protein
MPAGTACAHCGGSAATDGEAYGDSAMAVIPALTAR